MGEPIMKMRAEFKTYAGNGECTVHVSGVINESTDFGEIDIAGAKAVILDLGGVIFLNSMGLRNWVIWTKGLLGKAQFFFRNCPRPVVEQMSILQGFLPMGAIVESFFIPYHCKSCNHEEEYLATRGKDFMPATVDAKGGLNVPEKRPCPVCNAEMEWDVVADKYFSFLKYRK
jgi:anti-anti-sigma regulatory factor